jgi:hypothetical protein
VTTESEEAAHLEVDVDDEEEEEDGARGWTEVIGGHRGLAMVASDEGERSGVRLRMQ